MMGQSSIMRCFFLPFLTSKNWLGNRADLSYDKVRLIAIIADTKYMYLCMYCSHAKLKCHAKNMVPPQSQTLWFYSHDSKFKT